jgi:curved DNA-binding protein CbpA
MPESFDPYKIFGIDRDADLETIKRAHREKAKQYHPDNNPGDDEAAAAFLACQRAFEILSDPERRKRYDRTGADSDRVDTRDSEALELLMTMFDKAVQPQIDSPMPIGGTDFIASFRFGLQRLRNAIEDDTKPIRRKLERANYLAARFKITKGKTNVFKTRLEAMSKECDKQLAEFARRQAVIDRAEEILNDYRFETEPAKRSPGDYDSNQVYRAGFESWMPLRNA